VPVFLRCLQAFDEYLDRVIGVSAGTRRIYLLYARSFVGMRFGAAEPDWLQLTAEDVADFIRVKAASVKTSLPVTATRALLRFLATTGDVRPGLEGAVPTVRRWKHASLPRYLTDDAVKDALASCDETTAIGVRDRAILLLLVRLGLRAGEVTALALDDIDWRAGHLLIRRAKPRRERSLPLPYDVGQAIVAYVKCWRPRRPCRAVFLQARPPYEPLVARGVSEVAQRALARAGLSVVRPGAHVLRHTAATQMVRRGATLKQVADVLGHASLQTTGIYAKLDLNTLARVALPWPGGTR
jgi:site-specific recombinase XerD